jgi:hypothetical protein
MAVEAEVEPEEPEETDDAGPNWARMEELIDRTVGKHVAALDIKGAIKEGLKGWSPVVSNSKPSPKAKPEETPEDEPEPKRSDKTRKKGILSDWF